MKTFRARCILNDRRRRLVAIESVDLSETRSGHHCGFYLKVEPVALVVQEDDTTYALAPGSPRVPLDQLGRAVPGLDSLLAALDTGG